MKTSSQQNGSVLFRFAAHIIFALVLISTLAFKYPEKADFVGKLIDRLHSFFFDGSKKTGPQKSTRPHFTAADIDSSRDPTPPPPPPK